ncbi:MAG: MATE family efflux transporter [Clostridiaceae bacterium]|nr:MATE family efflux transporter [Clostridiaceae bacterium]
MTKKPIDKTRRMLEAPVLPLLLRMSGPAVFSMLIMSLYNIVDSLFVSAVSELALRAVSIIFPVHMLMIAFAVGTSVGVNSYVARSLGSEDQESADAAASHGFMLSFFNWSLFVIVGILGAPTLVRLFTEHADVIDGGVAYLRIITIASLGLFLQIHCEKIFQATGNMTRAMYMQLTGAVLNIVLDPILIFGWFGLPAMGLRGAAIATVVSQLIAGGIAVYVLLKREKTVKVRVRGFRFQKPILFAIYRVGFPAMVLQSVTALVGMVFNMIIRPFSEMAITVMGVYLKLESFVFMPVFGIGQGMLPLIAYNFGAKRYDRVKLILKNGLMLTTGIMAVSTVLFQLFPNLFLGAFNATPEMFVMGIPAFRRISLCFVFAGVTIVLSNAFQALGRGSHSLFISVFRQLALLLPLARLFAEWHLDYVWFSYLISDIGAMTLAIILYVRLSRDIMPVVATDNNYRKR